MLDVHIPSTGDRKQSMKQREPAERLSTLALLLVFGVLATGIIVVGSIYQRHYEKTSRAEIESRLDAIADLKSELIMRWRKERFDDGAILFRNDSFSAVTRRFLEKPDDAAARSELLNWLEKFQTRLSYDWICLMDTNGLICLSVPDGLGPVNSSVSMETIEAIRSEKVSLGDFYVDDNDHRSHLTVNIPIFDSEGDRKAMGSVTIGINPYRFLYPSIQHWPTPSRTAETLLVRKDGNDALFLNELKFQTNTALRLRIPLTHTDTAAVKAVLGQSGIVECVDYRGVRVVANVRAIPDSPWFMVTRIDMDEIYAPMRERSWEIAMFFGILLLGTGAATGVIWRQRNLQFYRENYRATEALRQSEYFFRESQRAAVIGSYKTDFTTGTWQSSEVLDQIFGIDQSFNRNISGWLDIVHPDDKAMMDKYLKEEVIGKRQPFTMDYRIIRKADSETRWVAGLGEVSLDSTGRPVAMVGTIQDITARKLAEEQILRQSRKLQEQNAEIERFTYTASHDLKSPLVTIKTFLGFLKKDIANGDTARTQKDLEFMGSAADKMNLLLEELLELLRVGQVVNNPVIVTFKELANETVGAVAGAIASGKVTVKIADVDITLLGDRARLLEIWQNLVENACKYMGGHAEPRVEIGVERGAPDKSDANVEHRTMKSEAQVGRPVPWPPHEQAHEEDHGSHSPQSTVHAPHSTIFYVRDNGMGIDPRYHDKVFNLFEKLSPSSEGSGLGLALVKRIVEMYQGRIWVESEGLGKGSTFKFTLPGAMGGV